MVNKSQEEACTHWQGPGFARLELEESLQPGRGGRERLQDFQICEPWPMVWGYAEDGMRSWETRP